LLLKINKGTQKQKKEQLEILNKAPGLWIAYSIRDRQVLRRRLENPRLDTLILAMPFSRKGPLAQYCGHLHRNFEGKEI